MKSGFNEGIWFCIQELVSSYNGESKAALILTDAGFEREELIKLQTLSAIHDARMYQFINDHFPLSETMKNNEKLNHFETERWST